MILQPYDMEVGAGTFHTATFLRSIGPEPWSAAYVQPSRRPTDGRYGENPFRLQHYYQYQVVIKPSPPDMLELYLGSLRALGFDPRVHDVRFVEDNWESPTLGAWGLGWEVWLNGMEITQFTYFQQVGGLDCRPVTGEITYGLERLAMYLQGVESIFDIVWTRGAQRPRHLWRRVPSERGRAVEVQLRATPTSGVLLRHFDEHEQACKQLLDVPGSPLPAYEQVLKASHTFNLLDARRAHLGHRAAALHPACAHARPRRGPGLLREPRALGFPMLREAGASAAVAASRGVRRDRRGHDRPRARIERRDLLVELGTEELPPKALRTLEQAFADAFAPRLTQARTAQSRHGGLVRDAAPARGAGAPPAPCSSPNSRSSAADRRSRPASTRRRADPRRAGVCAAAAAWRWRRSARERDAKGNEYLHFERQQERRRDA